MRRIVVDEAADGNEAIQRVRGGKNAAVVPYACIFVNLNMGDDGPDGIETVRALRELGFANTIVGLVEASNVALTTDRLWEAAWVAGANKVIVKGAREGAKVARTCDAIESVDDPSAIL